jgi:hypothetical protein
MRAPQSYEATLDRVGLALGVGAALGGCLVLGLFILGGRHDPIQLTMAWLLGTVFVGIGITAVAGPLWLVMHVAGLRKARYAAAIGALSALGILVGAQTWGFGLFDMPVIDNRTLMYRWASALLVTVVPAVLAALIAALMWRIAYRRVD